MTMKDIIIKNSAVTVYVNPFGAELKGIEYNGLEYLWQGDVESYPRTSPTLFPITGRFLSDTYYVGDRDYKMTAAGFAQNSIFDIAEQGSDFVIFKLTDNDRTRVVYPFSFELKVEYRLLDTSVNVAYSVTNKGKYPMPFVLGCHTAYKWPLVPEDEPDEEWLEFERKETLTSFNPFGWEASFLEHERVRPLNHSFFENYTRSITGFQSEWIELKSKHTDRFIRVYCKKFPYLAVWTLPDPKAAYLCLEPCSGLQPGNHPSLHLEDRDGAILLSPGLHRDFNFRIQVG